MKSAIVYYSMSGNTDYAARQISERTGADIIRISPRKAYPEKGFSKFFWGGKSAVMSEAPELLPYSFQAESYDKVIIGMPVWAGKLTPPLRTFINENREALKDKRILVFVCCSGGTTGAVKAGESVYSMLGINSPHTDITVLIDPKDKPSEENSQRIEELCGRI